MNENEIEMNEIEVVEDSTPHSGVYPWGKSDEDDDPEMTKGLVFLAGAGAALAGTWVVKKVAPKVKSLKEKIHDKTKDEEEA